MGCEPQSLTQVIYQKQYMLEKPFPVLLCVSLFGICTVIPNSPMWNGWIRRSNFFERNKTIVKYFWNEKRNTALPAILRKKKKTECVSVCIREAFKNERMRERKKEQEYVQASRIRYWPDLLAWAQSKTWVQGWTRYLNTWHWRRSSILQARSRARAQP